jgi:uncharacterized protein (TIGR03083 family)
VEAGLDYVAALGRESARFAEAITAAPPAARVPSCPEWTADDLLWHLAWVQWWWTTIVRDGRSGPEARQLGPERPPGRPGLLEFFRGASRDLQQVLAAASADAPAWTWSDDHTVGFIRRKQAHEALIHRVDAELAAGSRTPMDPRLSADGVDEALRVMYSGIPPWGAFASDGSRVLRLRATDTGDSWLVTLGRFTGTDPEGSYCDEPDFSVADADSGAPASALISGTAADLDCWLWHRPPAGAIDQAGDSGALAEFTAAIAPGL